MPTLTLLKTVQKFCARRGLKVPTAAYGVNDDTLRQIIGLLEETVQELSREWDWSELKKTITFVHADGDDNLAYSFNANDPSAEAVASMKNRTLWNYTDKMPVLGPLSDEDWQAMLAMNSPPAVYNYRMAGGGIHIYPVPAVPANVQFQFQGILTMPIVDVSGPGTIYTDFFTADGDYCILDYHLVLMGLRWRWNQVKGLPWEVEFTAYQNAVSDAIASEGTAQSVYQDGAKAYPQVKGPGILIPAGSWNV